VLKHFVKGRLVHHTFWAATEITFNTHIHKPVIKINGLNVTLK